MVSGGTHHCYAYRHGCGDIGGAGEIVGADHRSGSLGTTDEAGHLGARRGAKLGGRLDHFNLATILQTVADSGAGGLVTVRGTRGEGPVSGMGTLQLTGYEQR